LGQFSKNYITSYSKNFYKALKNMGMGSGIPDPGVKKAPHPGSGYATLKKTDTKFSIIRYGLFIPDRGSGFISIPEPGFRGQTRTGSRIRIRNTAQIYGVF
jgi:hypothetical protein